MITEHELDSLDTAMTRENFALGFFSCFVGIFATCLTTWLAAGGLTAGAKSVLSGTTVSMGITSVAALALFIYEHRKRVPLVEKLRAKSSKVRLVMAVPPN